MPFDKFYTKLITTVAYASNGFVHSESHHKMRLVDIPPYSIWCSRNGESIERLISKPLAGMLLAGEIPNGTKIICAALSGSLELKKE